jgi:hypothetical protein
MSGMVDSYAPILYVIGAGFQIIAVSRWYGDKTIPRLAEIYRREEWRGRKLFVSMRQL